MTVRVDALPPCRACGGTVFPLVLCDSCGAATILRDARKLDWTASCPECGTSNPWKLICDQCHTQFPVPGMPAGPPPKSPSGETPAEAAAPVGRPNRRIKGDVDSRVVTDLLRVLGLDESRAQALIDRGYDAPWKIARAKEDQLARIPEVGPIAARKMVASFHLINYAPPKQTKESIAQGEYECPLCQCVTSAFALGCIECGAMFEEEEMEEDMRRAFTDEGPAAVLAFFDGRLSEKPDDPELSYARGLLLESLGHADDAIAALDRAASKAPDSKKIKVAQLRLQARHSRRPEVAARLRSTAISLLDDVAWEQEVAQLDRVISEAERECPQCGASVPAEMAMCPSCGARLFVPRPAPPPKKSEPSPTPELDALVDDLLVGELEQSLSEDELEKTKAAVLDWLIEELEQSMAPDTQVLLPTEKPEAEAAENKEVPPVPSPLADSIGFLSQWVRGSRGLVSGLRPKRGPGREGRVNGIVNGKGRVNGLVNGVGRTNGLVNGMGRVNGLVTPAGRVNGLVTGTGRVNGLVTGQGRVNGLASGTAFGRRSIRGLRLPYPSRRVRYLTIASGILVAFLIAGLLFVPPSGPSTPIMIDGSFGDWSSVPMFDAATTASDPNVSIARYASLLDRDSLYLFVSTAGGMLGDAAGYDAIDFLIDGDGNASTGFAFGGIGADAVIEVFGGNHTVAGARLYSFPADSEVNWSRRQASASVQAAASASGLEVKASTYDLDRFDPSLFRVSVYADNFLGVSSRSLISLSSSESAVLVDLRPLTSVIGSGGTPVFEIHARAIGALTSTPLTVSNFRFNVTQGVILSLSAESVNLTQGRPEDKISVTVSAPGFFPGDSVQVEVVGASAIPPLFIRGGPIRAYVVSPVSAIRIDGLFADWVGRDVQDSDAASVRNSDVDILRSGAVSDTSATYFHVAVAGDLLEGRVPERIVLSPAGSGGNGTGRPILPPRRTGEDILHVYVDINASEPQGDPLFGIRADYLFEVRGIGGRITSNQLYDWTGLWSSVPDTNVRVAKNATDFEGSLPISATNQMKMVIAATEWSGVGDMTGIVGGVAPAPTSRAPVGVGTPEQRRTEPPVVLDISGNGVYWFRDITHATESSCTYNKVAMSTQGSGPSKTITLNPAETACWYIDETSGQTIAAGNWETLLDISLTVATYVVSFEVWDKSSDAIVETIGTCPGLVLQGDDVQCLVSGVALKVLPSSHVIRIVIQSAGGTVSITYDDVATTGDSRATLPIPEFGDIALPLFAVIVISVLVRRGRRRL